MFPNIADPVHSHNRKTWIIYAGFAFIVVETSLIENTINERKSAINLSM